MDSSLEKSTITSSLSFSHIFPSILKIVYNLTQLSLIFIKLNPLISGSLTFRGDYNLLK